jgi:hypothetical protein
VHRFAERVEVPTDGDYGFTGPFVQSKMAEATWKGSTWEVPMKFMAYDEGLEFHTIPANTLASSSFNPGGCANWVSLQRALENMVPVIEIVQNADNDLRAVELSVQLIVDYCFVPVNSSNSLMGSQLSTFPARLPSWYQPLSYLGAAYPTSSSESHLTGVQFLQPLATQLDRTPIEALSMDTSSNPAIQHLAIQSQSTPSSARGVLQTIRETGRQAHEALTATGEAMSNGYNIGRVLTSIGSKIAQGIRAVSAIALPAAEVAAPLMLL